MPLLRYFGFVGTALLTLLLVSHWLLPESTAEPVRGNIDKTFIRISSIEKLPEKVVFDTSLPYVAPPPRVAPPRTVAVVDMLSSSPTKRQRNTVSLALDGRWLRRPRNCQIKGGGSDVSMPQACSSRR